MDLSRFLSDSGWDVAGDLALDPRPAALVDPSSLPLDPTPAAFLARRHPDGIYHHQEVALSAALEHQNVCIATGTSSGKSLVFQTTAIQRLAENPDARILAVYPMKALGNEQEDRWRTALSEPGVSGKVARIEGSVSRAQRLALLRGARVVIATPDVIHAWLMTSIPQAAVQGFLKSLRLVVVDEIHTYTGVFGSNSTLLFRRLQHL